MKVYGSTIDAFGIDAGSLWQNKLNCLCYTGRK